MIDCHTHLLPGIDDGAQSVKEAQAMLQSMCEQGVEMAICTPHFDPFTMRMDTFVTNRQSALECMGETIIPLIPASETLLSECLLYYEDLSPLCIKDTNYLLVELSDCTKEKKAQIKQIEKLEDKYDVVPIIAHIERYPYIKLADIRYLQEMGCVIQMNMSSVLKKDTKRKCMKYLKGEGVDVLGSDCHNMHTRPPLIQQSLEVLQKVVKEEQYLQLLHNGSYLVRGCAFPR